MIVSHISRRRAAEIISIRGETETKKGEDKTAEARDKSKKNERRARTVTHDYAKVSETSKQ